MFSVHAPDGQVYGPVDTATIRTWIAQGRVTPETILVDAVTDRQAPARDVVELADAFSTMPPPPSGPSYGVPGGTTGTGYSAPSGFAATMGYGRSADSYPAYGGAPAVSSRSKVAAILLAFFLGSLGVHRFYLGYTKVGLAMLLFSVLTCFIGTIITSVIAIIDLILIATGSLRDVDGRELVN